MGTLLVHMAPPKEVPKKWPKPLFFKRFLMFFGSHSRRHGFEQAPSQTSATLHGSAISPNTCEKTLVFQQKRCPQRGHLEAPGWEDKKNGHPKWSPKSPQGICEKHSFFRLILHFLLFGIHVVAAPGAPFTCKIIKKALVLQRFGRLAWTQRMARKGTSQIIRNGFRISRGTKS